MLYSELPERGADNSPIRSRDSRNSQNLVVVVRQVLTWAVKRAISFFNSFCGHVLKQVACICYRFTVY